jgi:hypothetical protein
MLRNVITKFTFEQPTDQQIKDYATFVHGYEASLAEKQKKTKKKEKLKVHIPGVRNSKASSDLWSHVLVPDAETSPCNICANAQYNQLCCYARTCSALIYSASLGLGDITAFVPALANLQKKE